MNSKLNATHPAAAASCFHFPAWDSRSIVDQVGLFHDILAPKPAGAEWHSSNSLFAFWIGINDVVMHPPTSYCVDVVAYALHLHREIPTTGYARFTMAGGNDGLTLSAVEQCNSVGLPQHAHGASFWSGQIVRHPMVSQHHSITGYGRSCLQQVEELYRDGARSFLFLTVPPTNRAPLILEQGSWAIDTITSSLADYNSQLEANVEAFKAKHRDLDQVIVFDTRPIFNTLLDNADAFGFANSTGFCDAYQNGTPNMTTQTAPCAPVSSYL